MSDIQDLIHTQTVKAYESGVRHEQERITKLLESQIRGCSGNDCDSCDDSSQIVELIELIKGETNE
jgi:hypothetical protein